MVTAITSVPEPYNEPIRSYAPGSAERVALDAELAAMGSETFEFGVEIGGKSRPGGGETIPVVQPHDHRKVIGTIHAANQADTAEAIAAAEAAAPAWRALPFDERAAIFLRAADLLSGPWHAKINAATMLGQSKSVQQAEIDAGAELLDFFRFNAHNAQTILAEQPAFNPHGEWNRLDHRPLEGFVYAITPFNFTSIAGNLPAAPAIMGNVVLWKPSPTASLSAQVTLDVLKEAGLPDGVINLLPGDGKAVSEVALADPRLAGIHFTGSTATFQYLWGEVGRNISRYNTYPRLVGETGGKDFIVVHPSAVGGAGDEDTDIARLRTAIIRGAFDYQGQKCSAASRLYVPRSVWAKLKPSLVEETDGLTIGSPLDYANFGTAVIDDRAFAKSKGAIDRARAKDTSTIVAGGTYDDSVGYFVRPTIIESTDPDDEVFTTEFFGPVLGVYVFDDADFERVLGLVDGATKYGLTGSLFARDRSVVESASDRLRFAAGNYYVNDRPTGAVVGQQPFGGSRASGTNDKAGTVLNLQRWTSPRAIREAFVSPVSHVYPHQG